MRDKLISSVASILDNIAIDPDCNLVVGVSGGPDSLALMHILHKLRPAKTLFIGHLDHCLRPNSHADSKLVGDTAAGWNLAFKYRQVDVKKLAAQRGWTLEEAGRHARYQFLASLASEVNAEYVFVGHNADDQVETVVMHLLRGTGLSGLRGMRPVSAMPDFPMIKLVRPLLYVSREAIEAYCEANYLNPQLDETNEDPAFFRNRLRHELIPKLENYNPNIKKSLGQMAEILAAEDDYLEAETEKAWKNVMLSKAPNWLRVDRTAWQTLPLSLRRRTIIRGIKELRPSEDEVSFRAIDQAEKVAYQSDTGAQSALPGGLWLHIEYQTLLIAADQVVESEPAPQVPGADKLSLPIPGVVELSNGWVLSADYAQVDFEDVVGNQDPWQVYLDIQGTRELQVRGRLPGEKMQPLGMRGASALIQDIMVNKKLPFVYRSRWPIVVNGDQVVWIVRLRADERARVNPESANIVLLQCRRLVKGETVI